jgi:small conductance mechanosensitive channel
VLMAFDGTYILVPNSTVYKSTVHNLTANPKMRQEFVVRIGYLDSVSTAQDAAVAVLRDHPAILRDPEPMVLVDELDAASVALRVYYWVDARQYSDLKVRSSAMRLVKGALQDAKMLSPDGIQQVAFPKGVMVYPAVEKTGSNHDGAKPSRAVAPVAPETCRDESCQASVDAEGGLASDAGELHEQAADAPLPLAGGNLLSPTASNGRHER